METYIMKLKGLVAEDFSNYKEPSLFLITSFCDWKCCHDGNFDESVCQNNELVKSEIKDVSNETVINHYLSNPITKAVVIGGLEPFLQYQELFDFIKEFREHSKDSIVIYTGYYEDEIFDKVNNLRQFENIIIKFGRYVPNQKSHFDNILGVDLVSDNQYAKIIS